jgi:hypothetical protein
MQLTHYTLEQSAWIDHTPSNKTKSLSIKIIPHERDNITVIRAEMNTERDKNLHTPGELLVADVQIGVRLQDQRTRTTRQVKRHG